MVRFDDDRITSAKLFSNKVCDMAEVHQRRYPQAIAAGNKSKVIYSVVRHAKRLKVDIADAEVRIGFDTNRPLAESFSPLEALAIAVRNAAPSRVKRILGLSRNIDRAIDRTQEHA